MATIPKTKNYLNNKDILKEIHLSKNSYCSFTKPEYHDYDYIVLKEDKTLPEILQTLSDPAIIEDAKKSKASKLGISDYTTIPNTDLVFRIMTWDHIPLSTKQGRKITKKKTAKEIFEYEDEGGDLFEELEAIVPDKDETDKQALYHMKVNFPPFQHYMLDALGNPVLVGLSHWKGPINDGTFSIVHGKITNTLAKMYMLMCEKYALKYNWRLYTYNDELRNSAILQLTYVGLRFNEAKGNNPFSYYTASITNAFCRVLNTEKRHQEIRDDIMEFNNINPSWTRMNNNDNSGFFDE